MKAILITSYIPLMTGSGGSIGAYGIADSLQSAGFQMGICFCGVDNSKVNTSDSYPFVLFNCSSESLAERQKLVGKAVDKFGPNVVWIHPVLEWHNFSHIADQYPHVVIAGDPLNLIKRYRFRFDGGSEKNIIKKLYYKFKNFKEAKGLYRDERLCMLETLKKGIVAAYGIGDLPYRTRQINGKIELCELSFPNYQQTVQYSKAKNFLLVGNFNTIHTRYGIEFFLKDIWPLWKTTSLVKNANIRIVGGGRYPEKKLGAPPSDVEGLKFIGFVESLVEEYSNAIAVLVAVPIRLGFRTRVLEAWIHGVPVIMDASSAIGLPEAKHNINCLIAKNAEEFIEHSKSLMNNNELRSKIAIGGRSTFEEYYLSTNPKAKERYSRISNMAIEKFKLSGKL